jgi:peptide/nickel transport system permease protein
MAGSTPASATSDESAALAARPLSYGSERWRLARRLLHMPAGALGMVLTVLVVLVALFADQLSPGDPFAASGESLEAPSADPWFGTDNLRRDILRGVIHGARTSMTVGLAVVAISSVLGIVIGAVAGYRGGLVDDILMRLTEMLQAIPRFFLAILVVGLFGAGMDKLILLLGLTSWPLLARVVRAETMSVKQWPFVESARAIGARDGRILLHHVIPNVLPAAVVVISLMGSRVILIEAGLSFLGLGDPNQISWGYLINNAQRFLTVAWWMSVFPGLAIVVAVLGLSLLSDALNDVLNPLTAPRRSGA